ncbi:CDP-alcohol phosphatidyltransferase family protein [Reyranella sp.]|uniref:CDP-alcohol phosphatidyltransferase family protein n=1 Tax=Reyranella sp. TaxID=1929291 RepID=UPI003784C7D9
MFDPLLRRLVDPPLDRTGAWLAARGASANALTLGGLAIGLLSVPLVAYGSYGAALLAIVINRVVDGLDGAVARHRGVQPFGGYLDIVCDMAFYAAVPVGFALADQHNAVWASVLLASFICTASSFLARAVLAQQRGEVDDGKRGRKSFFFSAGIIEGSETILAFVLFCLFPSAFPWLAATLALLCFWTAAARVVDGFRAGDNPG